MTIEKRTKILTESEVKEFYRPPTFTVNDQRFFFALDVSEHEVCKKVRPRRARCMLMLLLGYFKAKPVVLIPRYHQIKVDLKFISQEVTTGPEFVPFTRGQKQPDDQEVQHILAAITGSNTPERAPKPYLQNLFDQYARYYDQHLVSQLQYAVPERLCECVTTENDHQTDLKALDLGCGTGLCGEQFRSYCDTLVGVDISSQMIAIATEKKLYDKLITADIYDALSDLTDFDLILAADVFSYIGELTSILSRCQQSLRPGGLVAFSLERLDHNTDCYKLQHNIRYAHQKNYIIKSLQDCHFTPLQIKTARLRKQYKQDVTGFIVLAQKKHEPE
jgi:predicted TPR repeat methyltransferase